jgi:hypothetical protein
MNSQYYLTINLYIYLKKNIYEYTNKLCKFNYVNNI